MRASSCPPSATRGSVWLTVCVMFNSNETADIYFQNDLVTQVTPLFDIDGTPCR